MEFQSTNPSFRVSWLLGLQPYQHIPTTPPWAKQYETNDPNFSVRFIIGIVPSKRSRRSRKPRTRRTVKQPVKAEEDDLGIDPFGLRRLFDDLSEEEVKEAEEAEQLPVDGEPEILAEAGFLELCSKMEQLLDDIEYVGHSLARRTSAHANCLGHPNKIPTIQTTNP